MKRIGVGLIVASLAALQSAPTAGETVPSVEHVQTVTGEAVPLDQSSQRQLNSDMVKICDLAIGERYLFVATYYSTTICVFHRDPETGQLTLRDTFENPDRAKWRWARLLTRIGPQGRIVLYYLCKGTLYWYQVDGGADAFGLAGKLERAGNDPIVISPDGRRLFTADAILTVNETGACTLERRRTRSAAALLFSPDTRQLYEATHSHIFAHEYDAASGLLKEICTVELEGRPDHPPTARTFMMMSPDGRHLYVGQQTGGYGAKRRWYSWRMDREAMSGRLTIATHGPPPKELTNVESGCFSPDGRVGYFIQQDPEDGEGYRARPAWFRRDPETGELTFAGAGPPGRFGCMAYDAAAGHLYAGTGGQDARNTQIVVFKTPRAAAGHEAGLPPQKPLPERMALEP